MATLFLLIIYINKSVSNIFLVINISLCKVFCCYIFLHFNDEYVLINASNPSRVLLRKGPRTAICH